MTVTTIEVWNVFITLLKETPNLNNCHFISLSPNPGLGNTQSTFCCSGCRASGRLGSYVGNG